MTGPLVSILIPCYNAERFVGAALECVLAQTYAPNEVIVVDDGSTDGSAAVLAGFAERGVRVLRGQGKGAAAARNQAFAAASGGFVLYLDADDWIGPNHVAALAARMDADADKVAMGLWARFVDDPAEARFTTPAHYRDGRGAEWLCADWEGGQPMTQCGQFLIPRGLIERLGGWDERLSLIDDFEFFARILAGCDGLLFAPGARLHYRSGVAGSLSGRSSRLAAESASLSLRLGTDHLLAAENSARTRRAAANILQTFVYGSYPEHPDLRRSLIARVAELGGANIDPVGPPGFHALRSWIGWRAARRVERLAMRLGLNRAARTGGPAHG